MHRRRARVSLIRVVLRVVEVRYTFDTQSEGAGHLTAPLIHLAGGMSVGVDRYGCSAHALEANRLPHDQVFAIGAGCDDDQVTRRGAVERDLNRARTPAAE